MVVCHQKLLKRQTVALKQNIKSKPQCKYVWGVPEFWQKAHTRLKCLWSKIERCGSARVRATVNPSQLIQKTVKTFGAFMIT